MLELFKDPYRPRNYSLAEVTQQLEVGSTKKQCLLRHYKTSSTKELMQMLKVSEPTVRRWLKDFGLSKPYIVKFRNHQETCIVFNNQTGIYYSSITLAANTVGLNKSTFRDCISGRRVNNFTNRFQIV